MARFELVKVPADQVGTVWPLIENLVEIGVRHATGRLTTQSLKEHFEKEAWQLFVISCGDEIAAIVGTEVYETIAGKTVARITFISGKNRKDWIDLLPTLEGWAESAGADIMETWARKGWARDLPDYKLTHVLLEKELNT